jgi:hypothetical protein
MQNPFGNIAPKNANWDLKRDVQKRIDKLEKRTQKALAEIACECSSMINWQIIPSFSFEFIV